MTGGDGPGTHPQPPADEIITLFNDLYGARENTWLTRAEDDPCYLPGRGGQPRNLICFAHGFYTSALHEIAHWLLAGPDRRRLVDYGYWYQPGERSDAVRSRFFAVEKNNQSLEWFLTVAAGIRFFVSVDEPAMPAGRLQEFRRAVAERARQRVMEGLPAAAAPLLQALTGRYGTTAALSSLQERLRRREILPE